MGKKVTPKINGRGMSWDEIQERQQLKNRVRRYERKDRKGTRGSRIEQERRLQDA